VYKKERKNERVRKKEKREREKVWKGFPRILT